MRVVPDGRSVRLSGHPTGEAMEFEAFRHLIRAEGAARYRDLPWRRTRDPYVIWLSEVMLQQTQVPRVEGYLPTWLERFPTVEALAAAPVAEVLTAWQGLGYNRRALARHAAAQTNVSDQGGVFPQHAAALTALPGIGPATAQGIRAFAFDLPGVYLETNVRTVFLHHFFPEVPGVPDRELVPLIEATCPAVSGVGGPYAVPEDADDTPRAWYYALLDYGAHLKKTIPNPSRRSAGHRPQSRFEGSRRQKRAEIVRLLLDAREEGLTFDEITEALNAVERRAKRPAVDGAQVEEILATLKKEGFCRDQGGVWHIV